MLYALFFIVCTLYSLSPLSLSLCLCLCIMNDIQRKIGWHFRGPGWLIWSHVDPFDHYFAAHVFLYLQTLISTCMCWSLWSEPNKNELLYCAWIYAMHYMQYNAMLKTKQYCSTKQEKTKQKLNWIEFYDNINKFKQRCLNLVKRRWHL